MKPHMAVCCRAIFLLVVVTCAVRLRSQPRFDLPGMPISEHQAPAPKTDPPKPTDHVTRTIEGWKVVVDRRLLAGTDRALGDEALRLLANRLASITLILPPDRLAALRKFTIRLDKTNGRLVSPQYHPNVDWLRENGYDPSLVHCVHIPDAAYFTSPRMRYQQPFAILHELAHAYHDNVLGFDDPEILAAWHHFVASGRYRSVLHIGGGMAPHYALTDQKEFFAEMTETYLGENDFYPFNGAELKRDEPDLYALMARIWGPLP